MELIVSILKLLVLELTLGIWAHQVHKKQAQKALGPYKHSQRKSSTCAPVHLNQEVSPHFGPADSGRHLPLLSGF